jgi:hypothetical protein
MLSAPAMTCSLAARFGQSTGIQRIFSTGGTWVSGIHLTLPCRYKQARVASFGEASAVC